MPPKSRRASLESPAVCEGLCTRIAAYLDPYIDGDANSEHQVQVQVHGDAKSESNDASQALQAVEMVHTDLPPCRAHKSLRT